MPEDPNKRLVDQWNGRYSFAEDNLLRKLRQRWDHFDRLYHAFKGFQDRYSDTSPRDKDAVYTDLRRQFGHELFIPHTFATVEEYVSRLLANSPRSLVLPRHPAFDDPADNLRLKVDQQWSTENAELKLQTVGRSGLMYGLGAAKTGYQDQQVTMPKVTGLGAQGKPVLEKMTEDRSGCFLDAIDIRDLAWDPFGADVKSCRWLLHRTWRDDAYVLGKLGFNPDGTEAESAAWGARANPELVALTPDDVKSGGGGERYSEVWRGRWQAQGYSSPSMESDTGRVHEVWECHSGGKVVVILDRRYVVAMFDIQGSPFHIFRPTEVLFSFCGKGVIEPAEDLQLETNMLRTDRRWNALLVLHQAWAYQDGAVDPDDVVISPGAMVPVLGDPNNMLKPLTPVRDIPNSGYQEEQALLQDWNMVTGLQGPAADGQPEQTATGALIAKAATQYRVQMMTRRVELEVAKSIGRHWVDLIQRRVMDTDHVRVPAAPSPDAPRPWDWREVPPGGYGGEYDFEIEGGSMAAENIAQDRQDAQTLLTLKDDPNVNGREALGLALKKLGVGDPQSLLAPEQPPVPSSLPDVMQRYGIPPDDVKAMLAVAAREGQQ